MSSMIIFLVYHQVLVMPGGGVYCVSPQRFESQLKLIRESGVAVLNPRWLSECGTSADCGFVLTFDDGTDDHFKTVCPILDRYEAKVIFYVPTAKLGSPGYMSRDQVAQVHAKGHVVGMHGHTHTRLDILRAEDARAEMRACRTIIEEITGECPVHVAPPGGFYNDQVVEAAAENGCRFFRTMEWGYNRSLDPMRIEVVPMTETFGDLFLKMAMLGRCESWLRVIYSLKNVVRSVMPRSWYTWSRGWLTGPGRKRDRGHGFED